MFLKFVDRTWILLGRLIDKGKKEGAISHIEIPLNEWSMLVTEWNNLKPELQKEYMAQIRVMTDENVTSLHPEFIMNDKDFVAKWSSGKYDIYYRDVKLVPAQFSTRPKKEVEQAESEATQTNEESTN